MAFMRVSFLMIIATVNGNDRRQQLYRSPFANVHTTSRGFTMALNPPADKWSTWIIQYLLSLQCDEYCLD